jgi:hypothetical protein
MSTDRIRGGAGILFAILGLVLLKGGAGFSESAAAPGCPDDPACYAEVTEEGVIGPEGTFVASHTATCRGTCDTGQECEPNSVQNSDGTTTWQCSCDWGSNSPSCSGYATVDGSGTVQDFRCMGTCEDGGMCRKKKFNVVTDRNCPTGYSLNRKCVCE